MADGRFETALSLAECTSLRGNVRSAISVSFRLPKQTTTTSHPTAYTWASLGHISIDALYFLQMLTQLSINTGNLALAETSANNMVKHDAGYPGTYWLLAKIKKKQGDDAKAQEYLAKAKEGYKDADKEVLKGLRL